MNDLTTLLQASIKLVKVERALRESNDALREANEQLRHQAATIAHYQNENDKLKRQLGKATLLGDIRRDVIEQRLISEMPELDNIMFFKRQAD